MAPRGHPVGTPWAGPSTPGLRSKPGKVLFLSFSICALLVMRTLNARPASSRPFRGPPRGACRGHGASSVPSCPHSPTPALCAQELDSRGPAEAGRRGSHRVSGSSPRGLTLQAHPRRSRGPNVCLLQAGSPLCGDRPYFRDRRWGAEGPVLTVTSGPSRSPGVYRQPLAEPARLSPFPRFYGKRSPSVSFPRAACCPGSCGMCARTRWNLPGLPPRLAMTVGAPLLETRGRRLFCPTPCAPGRI